MIGGVLVCLMHPFTERRTRWPSGCNRGWRSETNFSFRRRSRACRKLVHVTTQWVSRPYTAVVSVAFIRWSFGFSLHLVTLTTHVLVWRRLLPVKHPLVSSSPVGRNVTAFKCESLDYTAEYVAIITDSTGQQHLFDSAFRA